MNDMWSLSFIELAKLILYANWIMLLNFWYVWIIIVLIAIVIMYILWKLEND